MSKLQPTDDNRIYAIPTNYTITAYCDHNIPTDYSLKLVFPSDYHVITTNRCIIGSFTSLNSRYVCEADGDENSITLLDFSTEIIGATAEFTFTVNSIINPGTYDATGMIYFATLDESSVVVDVGNFT